MKKVLIACSLLMGLTFQSCSKDDDDDDNDSMTKAELLCSEGWLLESAMISLNGADVDAKSMLFTECQLDNITSYAMDNTLDVDEAANLCSGANQNESGTWTLSDDEETLSVTVLGLTTETNIEAISESSITLSSETEYLGMTATLTISFTH